MKDRVYLNDLYDQYSSLLTDTQRKYFESYYFDNLSLGEIAKNFECSRNAIHLTLKTTEKKLNDYEENLGLDQKNKLISKYIEEEKDDKVKEKLESLR